MGVFGEGVEGDKPSTLRTRSGCSVGPERTASRSIERHATQTTQSTRLAHPRTEPILSSALGCRWPCGGPGVCQRGGRANACPLARGPPARPSTPSLRISCLQGHVPKSTRSRAWSTIRRNSIESNQTVCLTFTDTVSCGSLGRYVNAPSGTSENGDSDPCRVAGS